MRGRDDIWLFTLFVLCISCQSRIAGDEPADQAVNPWLRPHFTVSVKSSESLAFIDSLPRESGVRRAFPDGLFANLIESVYSGLPSNISFSRTYLRCKGLGRSYRGGGHSIDVVAADSLEYEQFLLSKGNLFQNDPDFERLLKAQNNLWMLGGKDKVAVLRVRGGFQGYSEEIIRAIQNSLDVYPDKSPTADWSIKFKISELMDAEYWQAIQVGLAAAIQPADQTAIVDSLPKKECGLAAIALLGQIASDVESCELKADFDRESHTTKVSLVIESNLNGKLRESLARLSKTLISEQLPNSADDDFGVLGIAAIPPHSLFSNLASRLNVQIVPDSIQFAESPSTHAVFGIHTDHGQDANAFVVFGRTPDNISDFRNSEFIAAVLSPILSLNPSLRLSTSASPKTVLESQFWTRLHAHQQQPDQARATNAIIPDNLWMSARFRISQCVPILFPSLAVSASEAAVENDTIFVDGKVDDTRLVIIAHFPPNSDQHVYATFESVLSALQALSKALPFGDESAK